MKSADNSLSVPIEQLLKKQLDLLKSHFVQNN